MPMWPIRQVPGLYRGTDVHGEPYVDKAERIYSSALKWWQTALEKHLAAKPQNENLISWFQKEKVEENVGTSVVIVSESPLIILGFIAGICPELDSSPRFLIEETNVKFIPYGMAEIPLSPEGQPTPPKGCRP